MRHTALSAWLMRLGITVCHGRPWHPQTQGKEERFHRTLMDELVRPVMGLSVRWNAQASTTGKVGADKSQSGKVVRTLDHAACQALFDPWRTMYNQVRPHEALGMQTPMSRYQSSLRTYPEELLPVEYPPEPSQQVRRVQKGGDVTFGKKAFHVGAAFAGQPVAIRPTEQDGLLNVFFCHQRITYIDVRT